MTTKTCSKCGAEKFIDLFVKGLNQCKSCKAEYLSNYYKAHKDKMLALAKKNAKENSERIKKTHARWRGKNKERIKQYEYKRKRESYDIFMELARKRTANWGKKNPEKLKLARNSKIAKVSNSYISSLLHLPVRQIPPDLMEMKREQILNIRVTKQLTNIIKEKLNGI